MKILKWLAWPFVKVIEWFRAQARLNKALSKYKITKIKSDIGWSFGIAMVIMFAVLFASQYALLFGLFILGALIAIMSSLISGKKSEPEMLPQDTVIDEVPEGEELPTVVERE